MTLQTVFICEDVAALPTSPWPISHPNPLWINLGDPVCF